MQNYKVSTKIKTLSVEKVVPGHLLKQGFNWVVYEYSAKTGALQNAYWLADYPDFKNVAPLLGHAKQNCLLNTHVCITSSTKATAEVMATAQTQSQSQEEQEQEQEEQEEQETEEEKKETVLTVRLEKELANNFTESCQAEGKTKAKKTRELIENYTKTEKEEEALIALTWQEIDTLAKALRKYAINEETQNNDENIALYLYLKDKAIEIKVSMSIAI